MYSQVQENVILKNVLDDETSLAEITALRAKEESMDKPQDSQDPPGKAEVELETSRIFHHVWYILELYYLVCATSVCYTGCIGSKGLHKIVLFIQKTACIIKKEDREDPMQSTVGDIADNTQLCW